MARQILSAAINTARDAHYALNPASGLYERALLVEGASTNLCLQSENFGTTWTAIATPTRTAAAIPASVMGVALDLIGDDDAATLSEGYQQTIAFTGDAAKAVSVFLKKGVTAPANGSQIALRDSTASANRLLGTVTWDASGVPTVVMTTGLHLGAPIAYTNGIYRFRFQTAAVTAANTNVIQVLPTRQSVGGDTGNVYAGGVQAENLAVPTSYIKTTAATVARGTDLLNFASAPDPQELTVYARFIEQGAILVAGSRVFTLGNTAATTTLMISMFNGKYRAYHHNGTATVTAAAAAAPNYGDLVELRFVLGADGSVLLGQSINGAAEVVTAVSAANALPGAWAAGGLTLGGPPTGATIPFALQQFSILRGTQSLATMRLA